MSAIAYTLGQSSTADIETWLISQGWPPEMPLEEMPSRTAGGVAGERIYSRGRQAILKRHSVAEEYRQERDNLLLLHIIAPTHGPRLYARADGNLWLLMEDAGMYTYSTALKNGEMVTAWQIVDAIATVHASSRAHIVTLSRPQLQPIDMTTPLASALTRTRRSRLSGSDRKMLAATEQVLTRAMTNFSATGLRFSLGRLTAESVVFTGDNGPDSNAPQRVVFTEQMHSPMGFPHDDLTLFSDHPLRGEIIARYLATRARLGDTIDATGFQRIYAYREIITLIGMLSYHALTAFPTSAERDEAAEHDYAAMEQYYLDAILALAAPYEELHLLLAMLERTFATPYTA